MIGKIVFWEEVYTLLKPIAVNIVVNVVQFLHKEIIPFQKNCLVLPEYFCLSKCHWLLLFYRI